MVDAARRHGYTLTLGSVWPYDTNQDFPAFSAWFVERNVRPGAIIVLHDSKAWGIRTNTVLNRILPELKRQGYKFVTVSELLRLQKIELFVRALSGDIINRKWAFVGRVRGRNEDSYLRRQLPIMNHW